MKKFGENLKVIATLLLSVVMLVSITGLQMRFHQCDTSGKTKQIISLPLVAESYFTENLDCQCKPVEANIPHYENCTTAMPNTSPEDECCNSGSELFKMDMEYLANSTHKIQKPKIVSLFAISSVLLFENIRDQHVSYLHNDTDPIPISNAIGKFFVIANNQLKIPSA